MQTAPWQRRRSLLNHDWLKNRILPAVSAFVNMLRGDVLSQNELSFLECEFREIADRRPEINQLIEQFSDDMSPRVLLEVPPLSACDRETREWLGRVLHQRWLRRYPVSDWVADARAAAQALEHSHARLLEEAIRVAANIGTQSQLLLAAEAVASDCQRLARAIESFPNSIVVV